MFVSLVVWFVNVAVSNHAGHRPPTRCDFNFNSLPGWALKGMAPYNESSFTCKRDLTLDHYLNTPPIEPSLKEFSNTRKIPRWSGKDSNPRLRAQRQARSPNHPS